MFREKVYQLAKMIPKGNVATYGQLARMAGRPKAARAVGLFMKTNTDTKNIPCYKVVSSNGSLTGYSGPGGLDTKKELLKKDGIFLDKNDKVDLSIYQWQ